MQNCCSSTLTHHVNVRTALQSETLCDQGKRILCTLDETGEPIAIESRKVDCRRPLMEVTEMTDCGRRFGFGPQRQVFSFDPSKGQKIEFTPTLVDGSDGEVGTTRESQQNPEQSHPGD